MYKLKMKDKEATLIERPDINHIQRIVIDWFGKDIEGYSFVDSGDPKIDTEIQFNFMDRDLNVIKSIPYIITEEREIQSYSEFDMKRMLKGMSVNHLKHSITTKELNTLLINKPVETFREINNIRNNYEKLSKEICSVTLRAYENIVSYLSNKGIRYTDHINDYIDNNTGISIDRFNNLMRGMFSTLPTLDELIIIYYLADCKTEMVGKIKDMKFEDRIEDYEKPNRFPTSVSYGLDRYNHEEAARKYREEISESSSFKTEYSEIYEYVKELKSLIIEDLGIDTIVMYKPYVKDSPTIDFLLISDFSKSRNINFKELKFFNLIRMRNDYRPETSIVRIDSTKVSKEEINKYINMYEEII
jgi:hypothetical protein